MIFMSGGDQIPVMMVCGYQAGHGPVKVLRSSFRPTPKLFSRAWSAPTTPRQERAMPATRNCYGALCRDRRRVLTAVTMMG
jgi:hypothetical protein